MKYYSMYQLQSRNGNETKIYPNYIYKTLDIDTNGHISIDEMEKSLNFLVSVGLNQNSKDKFDVRTIFEELDLNKNDKIEPNEIDDSLESPSYLLVKLKN